LETCASLSSPSLPPEQFIFVALLANFGLSGVIILDKHYAGRTSIIGLLSNTFLCLGKVYGYRTLAKQSIDNDFAISLFESQAKNANTIEPDKQFKDGVYCPDGAEALRAAMAASKSSAAVQKALPPGPERPLAPAKGRERWGSVAPAAAAADAGGVKREVALRRGGAPAAPPPPAPPPPAPPLAVAPLPPGRALSTRGARTAPPPPPPPGRGERRGK
jgi:hypothetical protein